MQRLTIHPDRLLLATTLGLMLFGLVMVYSASALTAQQMYGTQYYFLFKQLAVAVIGIVAMLILMKMDYELLRHPTVVYGIFSAVALLLIIVLGLPATKGTHRFIRVLGFSLQPSELAKLAVIVFLAYYLEKRQDIIRNVKLTFLPCAVFTGLMMGLVLLGKDLGTTFIIGLVTIVMLLFGGVPLRYLLACALPVIPLLYWQLFHVAYRFERLKAFLDPWKYSRDEGFQVVQSLVAVGSGGIAGRGLAQGKQKLFYLPEAHTDFIYSVIGEELGLIGGTLVVVAFLIILWRGLRVANRADNVFASLLAVGITVMLVAQALFNISVVISLVPAKGIPLPFISYGGTSLLMSLLASGLLLNLSQQPPLLKTTS